MMGPRCNLGVPDHGPSDNWYWYLLEYWIEIILVHTGKSTQTSIDQWIIYFFFLSVRPASTLLLLLAQALARDQYRRGKERVTMGWGLKRNGWVQAKGARGQIWKGVDARTPEGWLWHCLVANAALRASHLLLCLTLWREICAHHAILPISQKHGEPDRGCQNGWCPPFSS